MPTSRRRSIHPMDPMNRQNTPPDREVQEALDPNPQHLREDDPNVARDPVCGTLVDKRTAQNTIPASADGSVGPFYFHSPDCKALFEEDPAKYGANY
jgi:YHS domain-containing protein